MFFLRVGIPGDEYNHILSFRKQVYIVSPSDNYQLQTSLVIPFENNNFRIFLSTDRMKCLFASKLYTNCPNFQPRLLPEQVPTQPNSSSTVPTINPTEPFTEPTVPTTEAPPFTLDVSSQPTESTARGKRPCPSSIDSSDISTLPEIRPSDPQTSREIFLQPSQVFKGAIKKPSKKKIKKNPIEDDSKIPISTKEAIKDFYLESTQPLILSVENFIAFLENTHGSNDPLSEAQKFTNLNSQTPTA